LVGIAVEQIGVNIIFTTKRLCHFGIKGIGISG